MSTEEGRGTASRAQLLAPWIMGAGGVICGLLLGGIFFLLTGPPKGQPIVLLPPPSPSPIQVHVAGAVPFPGVYPLAVGSRVQDAIQAAGGFSPQAEPQTLNLAAFVQDGERVYVPFMVPPAAGASPTLATASRQSTSLPLLLPISPPGLININTATQAELESLPGIGPVTAQKIIAYRQAHGSFQKIEEIMDVPGIGPLTFREIEDQITVNSDGVTP